MNSVVTQRFMQCFASLIESKRVRSARQFANSLDYLAQSFNQIVQQKREVGVDLIQKAIAEYHINPGFLFTGNGPMFLIQNQMDDSKILTIVTDVDQVEQIVHVPVSAQAGYCSGFSDPVFVSQLPYYSLPSLKFKTDGTMRSFDISGESMMPVINPNDMVICSYLHQCLWESHLKENNIYVIVTTHDVVVKRISNKLRTERMLLLHSDNVEFLSYAVRVADIKEIWQVRAKVSTALEPVNQKSNNLPDEFEQLKEIVNKQSVLLEEFLEKVKHN
ncbi:MAG: helix-turn-helix transcriptional regulator [Saprospiraceae bacterium]|nr:helix-turn-helix transcriptional regulator [Candidatus Defluviibacterium haderslevense]MBK7244533.1 helix-turn-helix transcriptional regulator [Candidatus Defluviibacterium haderslevense]